MLPLKIDRESVNRGLKARKIIKIEGDSLINFHIVTLMDSLIVE
jgi:hypothetical protein